MEKEKIAWHITTATHNSRYSQRMFDNYVKLGEPVWLSEKEELIVTETIAKIVEKDELNIIAYNICGDHMHILLVCKKSELPKIVGKIKSMSARACNIEMGRTTPSGTMETRGHAPLSHPEEAHPEEAHPEEAHPEEAHPEEAHPGSVMVPDSPISEMDNSTSKVEKSRGETQSKLWTQKFGYKEITSVKQLNNTIKYIQGNRYKHRLAKNKNLDRCISSLIHKI